MASFKTDESFLEKISIGAIGAKRVSAALEKLGHRPIELERGSMSFKIWKKIKIKRIRVPDILCIDNGIRVESRAKTKLEISMSHSVSDPARGWDFGMDDSDYVALVACAKTGERPIDWQAEDLVQFVSVKDLRESEGLGLSVVLSPKGSQEGFESRATCPSGVASADGTVVSVGDDAIKYKADRGRTNRIQLSKRGKRLAPLVGVGDRVRKSQIVASVVKARQDIPLGRVDVFFFKNKLLSMSLSERYAAVKALGYFEKSFTENDLLGKLDEGSEHIFIKLEAAASLARLGNAKGYDFLIRCLTDAYLQNVLETVIVLAEIRTAESCKMLSDILLDERYDPEIRAGAAWGLGEQQSAASVSAIAKGFGSIESSIKIEAARALARLADDYSTEILELFGSAGADALPGIAWALSKSRHVSLEQLIPGLGGTLARRQWTSYLIGMQGERRHIHEIEKLKVHVKFRAAIFGIP